MESYTELTKSCCKLAAGIPSYILGVPTKRYCDNYKLQAYSFGFNPPPAEACVKACGFGKAACCTWGCPTPAPTPPPAWTPACRCDARGTQVNQAKGDWCWLLASPCIMHTGQETTYKWLRCVSRGKEQVPCVAQTPPAPAPTTPAPATPAPTTGQPTPAVRAYKLGSRGAKSCTNGGEPITDPEGCSSALTSLGIPIVGVVSGSAVCYKDGRGNGYNNGLNGGGAYLICKVTGH
jgi:hypothetical protein